MAFRDKTKASSSHLWVGIFGKDVKKSCLSALSVAHHHDLTPEWSLIALHLAPRTTGCVRVRLSFSAKLIRLGKAALNVCFMLIYVTTTMSQKKTFFQSRANLKLKPRLRPLRGTACAALLRRRRDRVNTCEGGEPLITPGFR